MLGADAAVGMLYTSGSAWLNGAAVPKSAAVFSGDLLQTQSNSTANLNANGSSVMVFADSLVKFQGPAVEIEHGSVRISTSKGMATRADEIIVKPASENWTEFQVTDVDGQVQIAANKGDLTIQDAQGATTTLPQGQQTTQTPPSKKKRRKEGQAAPAASGGVMSSNYALYVGAAGVGALTIWALTRGEEPVSPACRTTNCQ
jgi:hypothetical protein